MPTPRAEKESWVSEGFYVPTTPQTITYTSGWLNGMTIHWTAPSDIDYASETDPRARAIRRRNAERAEQWAAMDKSNAKSDD